MTGVTKFLVAALLLTGFAHAAAPPVARRVKVSGMQMYYEVSGAGDPLIVLHGAYMNIPSMGAIIPKLAQAGAEDTGPHHHQRRRRGHA